MPLNVLLAGWVLLTVWLATTAVDPASDVDVDSEQALMMPVSVMIVIIRRTRLKGLSRLCRICDRTDYSLNSDGSKQDHTNVYNTPMNIESSTL